METQKETKQDKEKFNPQFSEIEGVQKNLEQLKKDLRENRISDPNGTLSRKANEIEKMYDDMRVKMKQTTKSGEQALNEMKSGFLKAWNELKSSANKAKDRFTDSPKH